MSDGEGRVLHFGNHLDASIVSPPTGLPFCSALGTLNHLVLSDLLWYQRLTGREVDGFPMHELSTLWGSDRTVWDRQFASIEAAEEQCEAQCTRMDEYIAELTPESLDEEFQYVNSRGEEMRKIRGPVLDHVFNHATHHR